MSVAEVKLVPSELFSNHDNSGMNDFIA